MTPCKFQKGLCIVSCVDSDVYDFAVLLIALDLDFDPETEVTCGGVFCPDAEELELAAA